MTCYDFVESKIGAFFEKIGFCIARHPWKIIVLVILVNGLLGIGMVKLNADTDTRVYTPSNSQAVKDEDKLKDVFPDKSGSEFYSNQNILGTKWVSVILKPQGGNILSLTFLNEVEKLHNLITNITTDNSKTFQELCAKRSSQCVVDGDLFLTNEVQTSIASSNLMYPTFTNSLGIPVTYSNQVSGAKFTGSTLTSATHLKLQYRLRSDTESENVELWQTKFVELMATFSSSEFDFSYAHSNSLNVELNSNIAGDIKFFSVTFTLMITYACCATYSAKHDCIGNRALLGFSGVLGAGLSIIASFGLVSACGMDFVSIVGNVPFLIIGIGVDDMFILLSGLADAPYAENTRNRIGTMMRKSGVAITITSLTDILGFCAGASSTFKSVRNFCVYTGVAVLFCYLNQAFLFSASLAVNERRVNSRRHFICCRKTTSKEEMKQDHASKARIFCCAGTPPGSREDVEGWPEKLPKALLTKFVLLQPAKLIILILFAGYLGASIYGNIKLKQGLVVKNLISEDSYFYKYSTWNDEQFNNAVAISFVFDKHIDYSTSETQINIANTISRAKQLSLIDDNFEINWLNAYKLDTLIYADSSETAFVQGLITFINKPQNELYKHDVVISSSSVTASRFYVLSKGTETSQQSGQLMLDVRSIASDSSLEPTAFAPSFIFYEQYVSILPQTLQTLGIGIAAIFVVTACFMPNPLLLVYVVLTIGMIMTGIVGFMYYQDLTLSSITMIHLIMSIGFSVDFTAHICHAYMFSNEQGRNERVADALKTAGGAIFNGATSSILGILMLAFAKSYIFKSFFQVMLLVMLIGVLHSLFFLPVLLSLIGPTKSSNRSVSPNPATSPERNPYNARNDPGRAVYAVGNNEFKIPRPCVNPVPDY